MSEVECICTCARAHPFSISCKRPVELRPNLVHGYWSMMGVFYTCRRRGCICACARADPLSIPATRTTNLRSAALPQKRCLAGNRRLVEHRDNNYSLELLFSQWETNLSYRNRGLNKQLCWRLGQLATLNNWRSYRRENFTQYALAGDLSNGVGRDPVKNLVRLVLAKYFLR